MWTTTVLAPGLVNTASWYLPVSSTYDGDYYVDTWIECDSHFAAQDARYRRYRDGTGAGITETYHLNQAPLCDVFSRITAINGPPTYDNFHGSNGGYMMIIDRSSYGGQNIGVDYLKYIAKH
jgi:hypothetical protein